jgi:hypothetical protein
MLEARTTHLALMDKDALYAWIGIVTLLEPTASSVVWNKNVISGFLSAPVWTSETTIPIINTFALVQ